MRTSTRCSRGAPIGRTRLAGVVKILLTLFLLYFISPNLSAQGGQPVTCPDCPAFTGTIRVDGNPCDWRSGNIALVNPLVFTYKADPYGNTPDTSFTEGSKDFMLAADLTWTFGQTKAKNDIANSAVAIVGDTLYFAGDRTSNNGDAQIGFWFYLNGTAPAANTHFAPEHVVGDILVLADFTGGGNFATVTVMKWVGINGDVPNTNGTLSYLTTCNINGVQIAENNTGPVKVPFEGNFDDPCYEQNEFYEGKIPLSCITGGGGSVCFSRFLLETRSSQSITASLDDFVSGAFTVAPTVVATGDLITCSHPTATLSGAGSSTGAGVTYLWTGPGAITNATSINATTQTGGVYTLKVTNSTGCTASATASVSVNTTAPTAVAAGGLITCTNTTANLTGTGSTASGVTYLWTGPGAITNATSINATTQTGGVYTLKVTNTTNGCTAAATASVSVNNTAPTAVAAGGLITCTNLTANLTGTGSTASGVTYLWTGPGAITNATSINATTQTGGVYTLKVTNTTNGCTAAATASVSVNNTAPTAVAAGGLITCTNLTANLTGTGSTASGVTYLWTGPGAITNATSINATTQTGGVYTLTVTNTTNGCTAAATASVSVNNTAPTAVAAGDLITCTHTTATLSGTGSTASGVTYLWTGPGAITNATSINATTQTGGVYTLKVTNTTNGCTAAATASVSVNNTAVTAVAAGGTITCTNLTSALTGTGSSTGAGITYLWTGPGAITNATSINASTATGGVYTLTVTNSTTGCTAAATASVSVNNTAPTAVAAGGLITCTNLTANLTGTGSSTGAGITYLWTGPGAITNATSINATTQTGGVYTLKVTNTTNGCTAAATASVSVNNTAPTAVATGDLITCVHTTATLSGAGSTASGVTYLWTGPGAITNATSINATTQTGGVYTLKVTNTTNGCTAAATASVSVNNTAVTAVAAGGTITCTNLTSALTGTGSSTGAGITYLWTGPGAITNATSINASTATGGVYTLTVTNSTTGCTAAATASVSVNNTAPTAVAAGGLITCTNLTANLTGTGSSTGAGITYLWTGPGAITNATSINATTQTGGVYTLKVTNTTNGCTAAATASVSVNNTAPTAVATGDLITCVHTTATLSGAGSTASGVTYLWTGPGAITNATSINATTQTGGVYTLKVTNTTNGCTAAATASVSVNNTAPTATATGGTLVCNSGTTTITGTPASGVTYLWTGPGIVSGSTTATATVNAGGVYTLKVTSIANGCTASATASVSVTSCDVLCTYTQGFFGNDAGKACDGSPAPNLFDTKTTIYNSITAQGGSIKVGGSVRSVVVTNSAQDIQEVIDVLPGGGNSYAFTHSGQISITALPASYLSKQDRLNNTLFAQTLTLHINMGIKAGLGSFALEADKWLVTADVVECGSTTVKPCQFACTPNLAVPGTYIWTVTYSPYASFNKISTALYNGLPTKNIAGLLRLADSALNGNTLPAGVSLGDIANAVDMINNAFDECRSFVGWFSGATAPTANSFCTLPGSATPCPVNSTITRRGDMTEASEPTATASGLQVSAYPNPFNDVVKFTIQTKVSGQAQLVVYNTLGQRVKTIYNGYIQANKSQVIEYKTPSPSQGSLFYTFTIGGKQVTGKLLKLGE